MLNYMRRHAQSATIKILFWIIIAVFILWGVGSFSSSDTSYAASVNGEAIGPKDRSIQVDRRLVLSMSTTLRSIISAQRGAANAAVPTHLAPEAFSAKRLVRPCHCWSC